MEKKFKLSIEEVLNKQFNIDFKGYSSNEVDEFLDLVIADYQEYEATIKSLGEHLQEYEHQNAALKAKIVELEGRSDQTSTTSQQGNLDILKRLTRLENEVFKHQ